MSVALKGAERRRETREQIYLDGTVEMGETCIDCGVENWSELGACLIVPFDRIMPQRFRLRVGSLGWCSDATMVWRDGERIGVSFR